MPTDDEPADVGIVGELTSRPGFCFFHFVRRF